MSSRNGERLTLTKARTKVDLTCPPRRTLDSHGPFQHSSSAATRRWLFKRTHTRPMPSSESSVGSSQNNSSLGNASGLSQQSDVFKPNRFLGCYLLVSRSEESKSAGRTYVGFTIDPSRRIKQHNGLLKYGGAKRTKRHRPWEMVAVVHGFASKTQGLQFEWAWQNPFKSVALKIHFDRPDALALPSMRRRSVKGCLQTLAAMVSVPPWCLCPLTLTICAPREQWEQLDVQSVVFPKQFRVDFSPLSSLSQSVASYDYRQTQDFVTPKQISGQTRPCPVCLEHISYTGWNQREQTRRVTYCGLCGVIAHVSCFAICRAEDDFIAISSLLPNIVKCRACAGQMHWSLIVRLSRALASEED